MTNMGEGATARSLKLPPALDVTNMLSPVSVPVVQPEDLNITVAEILESPRKHASEEEEEEDSAKATPLPHMTYNMD